MSTHRYVLENQGKEDLAQYVFAYQPSHVPLAQWQPIREAATPLILAAGHPNQGRVENDVQVLGTMAAHLLAKGVSLSLDALLSDDNLHSFEAKQQREGASESNRGRCRTTLHRLQAAYRGIPWQQRRPAGARVAELVALSTVDELHRVLERAACSESDDATAFCRAVDGARQRRAATEFANAEVLDPFSWARARRYARAHGFELTQNVLAAVVTHEVLQQAEPLAVLAARHRLGWRALDLGLVHAEALEEVPNAHDRALLRGVVPAGSRRETSETRWEHRSSETERARRGECGHSRSVKLAIESVKRPGKTGITTTLRGEAAALGCDVCNAADALIGGLDALGR